MERRYKKTRGSFVATDNAGKRYVIEITDEFMEIQVMGDSDTQRVGTSYRTSNNEAVNKITDGTFQILAFGSPIEVSSKDPLAYM